MNGDPKWRQVIVYAIGVGMWISFAYLMWLKFLELISP